MLKIQFYSSKLSSFQEITYSAFNELQYHCRKVLIWYTLSRCKTCSLGRRTFFSSRPSPSRERVIFNTFKFGNSNVYFLNLTPSHTNFSSFPKALLLKLTQLLCLHSRILILLSNWKDFTSILTLLKYHSLIWFAFLINFCQDTYTLLLAAPKDVFLASTLYLIKYLLSLFFTT